MEEKENEVAADQAADKSEAFREMLDSPLAEEDAQKALADIDVQVAQMSCMRLGLLAQLNQLDLQLAQAAFDRSIVIRRTLNRPAEGAGE